ncbi:MULTISPECIES: polyprenyl synthetase family protein [Caproicibacterium]|uniref:Farnesyl diphosphate synthase n=1 Tax=Caproicibacterium lactatifermentans TaxID=2666138 RepID=A0A859DVZ7_9FIRM|nr:farnesyl diphosphate synthase [Caproicibacterium lactatifermentans]MDD4808290.1 polyprenyl synthetase family protein [Oscillospiraceae bacterium]QKN24171.1 geranyl transferase [Caproicibacterium lactatifermentans]QKO30760.1 geranyl transferase [Caproicibacterium lactatifermentans]
MNQTEFQAQMKEYACLTEEKLKELVPEQPQLTEAVLYQAMRYSLLAGGKRVRPVMLLAFCSLCGGNAQAAVPFACALEMVHTYSLIHDDLPCMDDDDLRRGRPSSHKAFGEANALLAGDALLTKAFEVATDEKQAAAVGSSRALQAASILAQAAGDHGMVAGQVLDLLNENKDIRVEELADIDAKKTGAMIRAAAHMGCALAGASQEQTDAADRYARALGLAFQIQDDILDVAGSTEALGKPTGSDAQNEKGTYVTLLGLTKARQVAADLTRQAEQALSVFGEQAEFLRMLADSLAARRH